MYFATVRGDTRRPSLTSRFVRDPLFAPHGILSRHPSDQFAEFPRNRWPPRPRFPIARRVGSPLCASRLASPAAPLLERYANRNSATAAPTSLELPHPPSSASPRAPDTTPTAGANYLHLQRLARSKQEPTPQDQIPAQSDDDGDRAKHNVIMPQVRPPAIPEAIFEFCGGQGRRLDHSQHDSTYRWLRTS
jgi:hypothetical protein